jgi:hypothetical protein
MPRDDHHSGAFQRDEDHERHHCVPGLPPQHQRATRRGRVAQWIDPSIICRSHRQDGHRRGAENSKRRQAEPETEPAFHELRTQRNIVLSSPHDPRSRGAWRFLAIFVQCRASSPQGQMRPTPPHTRRLPRQTLPTYPYPELTSECGYRMAHRIASCSYDAPAAWPNLSRHPAGERCQGLGFSLSYRDRSGPDASAGYSTQGIRDGLIYLVFAERGACRAARNSVSSSAVTGMT